MYYSCFIHIFSIVYLLRMVLLAVTWSQLFVWKTELWDTFFVCLLWPTNTLFIKTGFLKLNEVLDLKICKLMQNTIWGFEVDHNCFTPVSTICSHNTKVSKKSNFVLQNPRTLLGCNSFRYLAPKLWSSDLENIEKWWIEIAVRIFVESLWELNSWCFELYAFVFCCILLSTDCVWFIV